MSCSKYCLVFKDARKRRKCLSIVFKIFEYQNNVFKTNKFLRCSIRSCKTQLSNIFVNGRLKGGQNGICNPSNSARFEICFDLVCITMPKTYLMKPKKSANRSVICLIHTLLPNVAIDTASRSTAEIIHFRAASQSIC